MTLDKSALRWGASILAVALLAGGTGYWAGHRQAPQSEATTPAGAGKVLYWYDPMFPNQKFDKPGKSPFMDMQLVPRYADGGSAGAAPTVAVDPAARQSLGLRVVAAKMGSLASALEVTGTIDFNQRDVAVIQARSGGFVSRVYARAPGDVVRAGAPIADLLLPEWGGAQTEYLSVRRLGKPDLTAAARQRLRLMGMSDGLIASVERSGRPNGVVTITTPISGTIQTLDARAGVTLAMGQTLAQVSGLGTVWLNAAVPARARGRCPGRPECQHHAGGLPRRALRRPGDRDPADHAGRQPHAHRADRAAQPGRPVAAGHVRQRRAWRRCQAGAAGAERSGDPHGQAHARHAGRRRRALSSRRGPHRPRGRRRDRDPCRPVARRERRRLGAVPDRSEASLSGIEARPIGGGAASATIAAPASKATLYETTGKIERITANSVTLSHEPVPALDWPAMTMTFALANPGIARGFKAGDRVRFGFDRPPAGPTLRHMAKVAGQ
jgi:Cu(I)/Ag(I) efflux system membrane fusion protein